MPKSSPKIITTITSAYNEEKTITEIVRRLKKYPLPEKCKKQIIIVDNGSTDNTGLILRKLKGIILINVKKNKGKGDGIRHGLKKAAGDVIVIQDADLEYDPQDIQRLIRPILDGKSHVVYGSRIKRRRPIYLSLAYYVGNIFITKVFNLLYQQKLTDISTAYKAFDKDFAKTLKLSFNDFGFDFEISAKAALQGVKISEVSVSYHPRSFEDGKKITPWDGLKAIWVLLKYRF